MYDFHLIQSTQFDIYTKQQEKLSRRIRWPTY